jgi:acyl-coenzyme A thioesterase PaaI-like protein
MHTPSDIDARTQAPEGWRMLPFEDAYQEHNGPYFLAEPFESTDIEPMRFGFRVGPHNCSFAGTCHGGMIAATLDIAMGRSMARLCGEDHAPTISMSVDFMRSAKLGEWIESRVRILRRTRSLVFCDAVLLGSEGVVARGGAVFKLLGR